jgi:hypothetical protein
MPLQTKLDDILRHCFVMNIFPDLQKKLDKFSAAVSNPSAQLLLKRGRK